MVLVALTGWGQEEDRRRSYEAGFDHHIVKPIDFATVEKLLKDLNGSGRRGEGVAFAISPATPVCNYFFFATRFLLDAPVGTGGTGIFCLLLAPITSIPFVPKIPSSGIETL